MGEQSPFFCSREEGGEIEHLTLAEFLALLDAEIRPAAIGIAEGWRTAEYRGNKFDVPTKAWIYDFELEPNEQGGYRRSKARTGAWRPWPNNA